MKVFLKQSAPDSKIPQYQTEGSAGCDLHACLTGEKNVNINNDYTIDALAGYEDLREYVVLEPGERALIPTGIKIAIPEGYEAQVRSRSGMAYKQGLVVANAPGTIDSDYRGEICVILQNTSREPQSIKHGDRIAQLVFNRIEKAVFEIVQQFEEDSTTIRNEAGFGSTGVS